MCACVRAPSLGRSRALKEGPVPRAHPLPLRTSHVNEHHLLHHLGRLAQRHVAQDVGAAAAGLRPAIRAAAPALPAPPPIPAPTAPNGARGDAGQAGSQAEARGAARPAPRGWGRAAPAARACMAVFGPPVAGAGAAAAGAVATTAAAAAEGTADCALRPASTIAGAVAAAPRSVAAPQGHDAASAAVVVGRAAAAGAAAMDAMGR